MTKLFVFDLDFTLWDAGGLWCDCTTPPYFFKNGKLFDTNYHHLKLYPDTIEILEELSNEGHILAVASRTSRPEWAKELMHLFNIDRFFKYKEIYPTTKIKHLKKISEDSGHPLDHLILFDDEYRNIEDARSIGVQAVYVRNGIDKSLVAQFK